MYREYLQRVPRAVNTAVTLSVGKKTTLTAIVAPVNATLKSVTWSSSNENVAKVDANGTVIAVGEGKAIITVTTVDGGYTATCTINAVKAKNGVDPRKLLFQQIIEKLLKQTLFQDTLPTCKGFSYAESKTMVVISKVKSLHNV